MIHQQHLSPEKAHYERIKAERANFIVSEVVGDPELMQQAMDSLESSHRGISMLWQEFRRWESSRNHVEISATPAGLGAKFELRISPQVRDIAANLTPEDRDEFERHLHDLCMNPYIDNVTKFALPYPPVVLFLYQDGPFRVVYRIMDQIVVDILQVSPAPYIPTIAEWDDPRRN